MILKIDDVISPSEAMGGLADRGHTRIAFGAYKQIKKRTILTYAGVLRFSVAIVLNDPLL